MLSSPEIHRIALEKIPHPCAFVSMEDRFLYVNAAWTRMLGYTESEMREVRWQDITKTEHIGGDSKEADKLKKGQQTEFFTEKVYISKLNLEVPVSLYVHRYPSIGPQIGYIAFAKEREVFDNDIEFLKNKFRELEQAVAMFTETSKQTDSLAQKIAYLENHVAANTDKIFSAMSGGNDSMLFNFGESHQNTQSSNNNSRSGKAVSNSTVVFGFLGSLIAVSFIGLATMAGYIIYITNNNASMSPPPDVDIPVMTVPLDRGDNDE